MADDQKSNGAATPKEGMAAQKPTYVGVMDQLLRVLSDKVLNMETAVRGNTAQIELMANTVDLVRGLPDKVQSLEKRVIGTSEAMSNLQRRIETQEVSVLKSIDASNHLAGSIQSLHTGLQQHAALFERPLHKSVEYRHIIGKAVWVVSSLSILCAGLVACCILLFARGQRYAASEVQWRAAQLITDSVTLRELQTLKQNYVANPDSVRMEVIAEEDRRKALDERIIERNQKNEEIDELKKQRK